MNLLSNALKFTHQRGITVAAKRFIYDEVVEISVTNTGIGSAADDYPHLFDDCGQCDESSTRSHGSLGLGLSVCQRLATLLGGGITVESQFGHGARFTLALPLREQA